MESTGDLRHELLTGSSPTLEEDAWDPERETPSLEPWPERDASVETKYGDLREELLTQVRFRGVRRLARVFCDKYPEYVLELLQAAAPHLTKLQLFCAGEQHLQRLSSVRLLERLEVVSSALGPNGGKQLKPVEQVRGSVKWLSVRCVPLTVLQFLLEFYAPSVEWLQLEQGPDWRQEDIVELLRHCKKIQHFLLLRRMCNREVCKRQRLDFKNALPERCKVFCWGCDEETFPVAEAIFCVHRARRDSHRTPRRIICVNGNI